MDCRHHPTCPGCPLAGMPYDEQLAKKQARLARAVGHFTHLPEPEPIVGSRWTEAYRHRLKLPVHVGRDHVAIGLYSRNGGRVLDTPDCPVLVDALREALPPILTWLRRRRGVHSVDLRASQATGELQVIFACRGGELDGGARAARALLRDVPTLASVAVSQADPKGKRVMGSRPRVIAGRASLEEAIGETRYDLLPGAFFQVDPRQAEVVHQLVREGVGQAQTVLDLYAGVGAYALMLAPGRRRVVAVEEVPQAAEAARRRAPAHMVVHTGRVEEVPLKRRADVAILNPARRGADPGVLAHLATLTERLVYVSCGPETLARDLDVLAAHGLRTERLVPVDLFPQTPEVETVAVLTRDAPLRSWAVGGGRAQGPWHGRHSGAVGRPTEVITLLLGDVRPGDRRDARVVRLNTVAGHSLVRLELRGPLSRVLGDLARRGHPVAGQDQRTKRFFTEKAGLVRPFVHVSRAGRARAPLHGDLVMALEALGAAPRSRRPRRGKNQR